MAAISGAETKAILVKANELAKSPEDIRLQPEWAGFLEKLTLDKCPKTYLVVTCILLCARSMHPAEDLNVLEIKRGSEPISKGYSAPSIGGPLAAFAKEHQIDLRATSQQPMNNQPFTYKDVIVHDMGVRSTLKVHWDSFFAIAKYTNDLSPEKALHFLAYIFANRRISNVVEKTYKVDHVSWQVLEKALSELSEFIDSRSDSGKVGQAFASALLDLLYSPEFVEQGNSQDPDAKVPGDVHVRGIDQNIWLWVEVKQQPIQTGQVIGFINKVSDSNGERVIYLALKNADYPSEISLRKVQQQAAKKDIRITIFQSPQETLDWFLEFAPGSYSQVMETLLERIHARLVESGCSAEILAEYESFASSISST